MDRERDQQRDQEPGQVGKDGLTALPRGLWPTRRRRFNWHLGTLIWLAYLLPGVVDLLKKPLTARVATELALLGVFVAGYVYVLARPPWASGRPLPGRPLALVVTRTSPSWPSPRSGCASPATSMTCSATACR